MKLFLIVLLIASYLGGFFATLHFNTAQTWGSFFVIVFINSLCGRYLYARASRNKMEWALFGLLGNLNAVFIFWLNNNWIGRPRLPARK